MRSSIYRELTEALLQTCREAVHSFAMGTANQDVYAFAFACDAFYGDVSICINTLDGFQRTVRETRPRPERHELEGLHGIKYDPTLFAFKDFVLPEEILQLLDEIAAAQHDAKTDRTAEKHGMMLLGTLIRAIILLEPAFDELQTTPSFIAFVHDPGAGEHARIELLRKTVSPELFDAVFPEVRAFGAELARVEQEPPEARARFWSRILRELATGDESSDARRLLAMGKTRDDFLQRLGELGSSAVSEVVDVIEEVSRAPQLNRKGSTAYKELGPQTAESVLTGQLVELLRALRLVDEHNVERLHHTLKRLHKVDKANKTAGPNTIAIADLLHDLRPQRFSTTATLGRDKRLANASAFGLR